MFSWNLWWASSSSDQCFSDGGSTPDRRRLYDAPWRKHCRRNTNNLHIFVEGIVWLPILIWISISSCHGLLKTGCMSKHSVLFSFNFRKFRAIHSLTSLTHMSILTTVALTESASKTSTVAYHLPNNGTETGAFPWCSLDPLDRRKTIVSLKRFLGGLQCVMACILTSCCL